MIKPKALVLHAAGTNRDPDVRTALSLAGAEPEIVHLNRLRAGERRWEEYSMLVIPGGFSYADALGAGRLLALDLSSYFADEVSAFVSAGKPVIGICNGFQALVKSGILPGGRPVPALSDIERRITLTRNALGRFECRWVRMAAVSAKCLWTKTLSHNLFCPVAHGEGRFVADSEATLAALLEGDQVAFVYARADGGPAGGEYPDNPNGSAADIAGICNEAGNALGLMPHPENNVFPDRQPRTAPDFPVSGGLELFRSGVRYAAGM